jgi:hypothetical protein
MTKVLVSDPIDQTGIDILSQVAQVDVRTGLSAEELKAIMLPDVMDVALFPIFPVIHDDLVEAALQNMEKRTIALEETAYADEPNRVKCGKTMEDRRKILQKQLEVVCSVFLSDFSSDF